MCGIAGILNNPPRSPDVAVLQQMADLIRHRGPDDHGLKIDGPAGLAHRRLSIIDLSPRGHNPMSNEDGTIWIVYNGEIYNHREFRPGLEQRGHIFRSNTDTEVILHLYEELGERCVEQLNGMFAFALWDSRQKKLLLARDRFGVKPLYYTETAGALLFASEIKAFLAHPDFRVKTDLNALSEHLTFQNTLTDRSFFSGVKLLPAGHTLVLQSGRSTLRQYWDLRFDPDNSRTTAQWREGLRERFEAAVQRQLMSDVPLGSFLSGGMDTGAIAAVATRRLPGMHTFTCGFELPSNPSELEKFFDETIESESLARQLGTIHHKLRLGPEAMIPVLPQVIWHLDEPRVGISYQIYQMTRMVRRHVTVVLSGVGGDELFAGYPWRYAQAGGAGDFASNYYHAWNRLLPDARKAQLLSAASLQELGGFRARDTFDTVLAGAGDADPLHRALYFDFKTFLNGLLVVDDKLAMAHSVEGRVPFLDNDLVDYVSRMPSDLKLRNGQGKYILREAMRGLLPDETIDRRKQGFTPPDQSWYRGKTLRYIRDLLLGPRALERGYFEPAMLETILQEHLDGVHNHRFLIWSLMGFEWWNRLFLDRDALPTPETESASLAV